MTNDNRQQDDQQESRLIAPGAMGLPAAPVGDVTQVADCLLHARRFANVLAPATLLDYLPPDHVISFMVVQFPIQGIKSYQADGVWMAGRQQSNGLWYATDGGQLAMHRVALDQLAQAAGISSVPADSYRTDDRTQPFLWAYQATVSLKGIDGKVRKVTRSFELDLNDGSPAAAKAGKGLRNTRISGAQLAQSKAVNRAIRAALGIRAYTVVEADRPFVLPVLRWVPDMSDPVIRRMVAAKELGIVGEVYGGGEAAADVVLDVEPPRQQQQPQHQPRQLSAPSEQGDGIEEARRRNADRQPVQQRPQQQERPQYQGQRGGGERPQYQGSDDSGRWGDGS